MVRLGNQRPGGGSQLDDFEVEGLVGGFKDITRGDIDARLYPVKRDERLDAYDPALGDGKIIHVRPQKGIDDEGVCIARAE
jgi:hypothetical protein